MDKHNKAGVASCYEQQNCAMLTNPNKEVNTMID